MFPGYASRLLQEMKNVYIEKTLHNVKNKEIKININIIDSPRRKHSVFIGATILANFYNKKDIGYWITKEEYEESGEQIILRKCPNMTN
jgi:actin-related protein 2